MVEQRNIIGTIHALGKGRYPRGKVSWSEKYFYNFKIVENPSMDLKKVGKHDIIFLYSYPDEELRKKLMKMRNPIIPGFLFTYEGTFDIWAYENADYLKRTGMNILTAENMIILRSHAIASALKGFIKGKKITVYGSYKDFRWAEKEPLKNSKDMGVKINLLPVEKLLDCKKIKDADAEDIVSRLLPYTSRDISKSELNQVILCHCSYLGAVPPSIASYWKILKKMDMLHCKIGLMIDAKLPPAEYTLARFDTLLNKVSIFKGHLNEIRHTGSIHGRILGFMDLDFPSKILHENCVNHHYVVTPSPADKLINLLEIAGIKTELIGP